MDTHLSVMVLFCASVIHKAMIWLHLFQLFRESKVLITTKRLDYVCVSYLTCSTLTYYKHWILHFYGICRVLSHKIAYEQLRQTGDGKRYITGMSSFYQSTEAVKQLYIIIFASCFYIYISECMLKGLIVKLSKIEVLFENQAMQYYRGKND